MFKKNNVTFTIICFFLAALTVAASSGCKKRGSVGQIPPDEVQEVKCKNCSAEYEMNKKEFFEELLKSQRPGMMARPMLPCRECAKEAIAEAVKCSRCDEVFFPGSGGGKFKDKCSACGYSAIEEKRNDR